MVVKNISILFCVLILGSCKKDPDLLDYRNDFIGKYNCSVHSYSYYGVSSSFTEHDTIYSTSIDVALGYSKNTIVITFDRASKREVIVSGSGEIFEGGSGSIFKGQFSDKGKRLVLHSSNYSPAWRSTFDLNGFKID
ncbi:MAG: hypothetical protein K0Q95_1017 [Bacteroidota bacterium]|jgi:hypothetical protein|nr:hypothetical protein [Bacteroidota bacterium]